MNAELKITEQDLTAICDEIIKVASTRESGNIFDVEYTAGQILVVIIAKYKYRVKEVRGGNFEYWSGHVEYERLTEITDEYYTIGNISAFCDETELEVPEDLEKRLTNILNNKA